MRSKRFDNSGFITDSSLPFLFKASFFPEGDGDSLTIYDNEIGPERGAEIAHLDKNNPTVDFGETGQRCSNGLYALLLRGGSFYVTWED